MNRTTNCDWRKKLPGCFGIVDLKFALHPLDEGRAKQMMKLAFKSGASIEDVLAAISAFLESKGATDQHIAEQLEYAKKLKFGA